MNHSTEITAGVIIIGNEVLSGRTQDTNLAYMGKQLDALGIRIMESRVIPDINIIVLTGYTSIATAIEAIKLGATYYPNKPADADKIVAAFARG